MDQATLRTLLVQKTSEWSAEADQGKKDGIMTEISTIKNALSLVVKEDEKVKAETTLSLNETKLKTQEKQIVHREIMQSLDSVPMFNPGHDVHLHVSRLANLFEVLVKGREDSDKLEETFIRNAKKRMHDSYLTQMINSGKTIESFEEFKTYMVDVHESKQSHFQKLNQLWQMVPREKETFTDLASRLENLAHEVRLSILAKWKKNNTNDTDIPSKNLFDLVIGQILLTHIQSSRHSDVYRYIASELDTAWTAKEIANRAMTISDRIKSESASAGSFLVESNAVQPPSGGDNGEKKKSKRKDDKKKSKKIAPNKSQDCFYYLDGNCKKGDQCGWRHDPAKFGIGRPREKPTSLVTLPNFSSFQH